MKKKQRKSYAAAFKVKISLEAIKRQRTINEIATHYGVHPNMVTQWKKQTIESLPDVFSTRRERDAQGEEALKTELYQPGCARAVIPSIASECADCCGWWAWKRSTPSRDFHWPRRVIRFIRICCAA
jgi:transposase